jgi:hypothetical protein
MIEIGSLTIYFIIVSFDYIYNPLLLLFINLYLLSNPYYYLSIFSYFITQIYTLKYHIKFQN